MTDIFKLIEDHGLTLHGDIEHFAELVRAEKREWVGLTKMELIKLGVFPFGMSYELYEAIEAKLKEKNT